MIEEKMRYFQFHKLTETFKIYETCINIKRFLQSYTSNPQLVDVHETTLKELIHQLSKNFKKSH